MKAIIIQLYGTQEEITECMRKMTKKQPEQKSEQTVPGPVKEERKPETMAVKNPTLSMRRKIFVEWKDGMIRPSVFQNAKALYFYITGNRSSQRSPFSSHDKAETVLELVHNQALAVRALARKYGKELARFARVDANGKKFIKTF